MKEIIEAQWLHTTKNAISLLSITYPMDASQYGIFSGILELNIINAIKMFNG